MSAVLAEFLQQFFTFFTVAWWCCRKLAGVLLLFVPFDNCTHEPDRPACATRPGAARQAGRNPDHSPRNHHRPPDRQGFRHENWESERLRGAPPDACPGESTVDRCGDEFAANGYSGFDCHCAAGLDGTGLRCNRPVFTAGTFLAFIVAVFKLYDPVRKFAMFNNNFQQAVGASSEIFRFMDAEDEVGRRRARSG